MHSAIKAEIIALARATPTEEVCGFVYHDGVRAHLMPCRNVAEDPTVAFEISVEDQMRFEQKAGRLGVYHSHPHAGAFSPEDLDYAAHLSLPQWLYDVEGGQWHEYTHMDCVFDLEGQPFILGFHDCYGLLRDFARQVKHHSMRDYDRDESYSHEPAGTIMASYALEGYEQVQLAAARPDDVLLFRSNLALPQHFAVLREGNRMLHHPRDTISRVDMLTDRWLCRLVACFRLKGP